MYLPAARALWVGLAMGMFSSGAAWAGPSEVRFAAAADESAVAPSSILSPPSAPVVKPPFDFANPTWVSGLFLLQPTVRAPRGLDAATAVTETPSSRAAAVPLPPAVWSGLITVAVVAAVLAIGQHRRHGRSAAAASDPVRRGRVR